MADTVPRDLAEPLRRVAGFYPVVTVTGPRQSGKSTLCRTCFPDKPYVNLEALDVAEQARTDPRGFLAAVPNGAILDEIQNAPELLSYLQVEADRDPTPGRFLITGSQNLDLGEAVSQSLAGRTGVLRLLPLSLPELRRFATAPTELFATLWSGGYPAILDRAIPADVWLADYTRTYVQRDVRRIQAVSDLDAFIRFTRLCAGSTGAELNLSRLGADAGISHVTAQKWLSVLEAGFLCFRLPSWHTNLRKQVVKTPKLHFFDTGLVCSLLGIRTPEELLNHPLRGAIFETWVASETYKAWIHRGLEPRLWHFRATRGPEVDLVVDQGREATLLECKSGATVSSSWFSPLGAAAELLLGSGPWERIDTAVVHGGANAQVGSRRAIPWATLHDAVSPSV